MSSDKNINRWSSAITPRDKAPLPWTIKSGGSWDMLEVQPISDEMLSEMAHRYYGAGTPWNCRSMPLSDSDREYMFMLYFGMQGLVARLRIAEAELARRPAVVSEGQAVAWAVMEGDEAVFASRSKAIADNWVSHSDARTLEPLAFCRPAAPAPEAPTEHEHKQKTLTEAYARLTSGAIGSAEFFDIAYAAGSAHGSNQSKEGQA